MHLVQGSVADVPLQHESVAYVLDIGCYHTLPRPERERYIRGVLRVLRPGGYYHLYGFDVEDDVAPNQKTTSDLPSPSKGQQVSSSHSTECANRRGIGPTEIVDSFGSAMDVVYIDEAIPNPKPCRWYLFRKR